MIAVAVGLLPFSLTQMHACSNMMPNLFHFPDLHRMRLRYIADVVIVVVVERFPFPLCEVVAKSVHPFRKMFQSSRSWFSSDELLSQFLTPAPSPMPCGIQERSIQTGQGSQTEINQFSCDRNFFAPCSGQFFLPSSNRRCAAALHCARAASFGHAMATQIRDWPRSDAAAPRRHWTLLRQQVCFCPLCVTLIVSKSVSKSFSFVTNSYTSAVASCMKTLEFRCSMGYRT